MKRLSLIVLAACGAGGTAEPKSTTPPPLESGGSAVDAAPPAVDRTKELTKLGAEAYAFGYPPLFMERQKRTMTANVRLPLGTFAHTSKLATPADADIFPSLDTLLSSAWLELGSDGAWTLKLPAMADRWFAVEMLDAYGEPIGAVSPQQAAGKATEVVITGPSFAGKLPANAIQIKSTTSTVWVLGRTRVMGDKDLPRLTTLLKGWSLTPLPPTKAPTALPPPPLGRPQDLRFGGPEIFDELGDVMKAEAPPGDVASAMASKLVSLDDLAKAGIGAGLTPNKTLPQEQVASLAQGIKDGAEQVEQTLEKLAVRKSGWDLDATYGSRGADPLRQAAYVLRGLDWPFSTVGLVYVGRVDDGDRVLSGAHDYTIHFDAGKLPPAKAFWTMTMYTQHGALVPSQKTWVVTDTALKKNADGSLDVLVQADAPAKSASNWLPAPKNEAFMVALRVYQPGDGAGSWEAPPIKRVK